MKVLCETVKNKSLSPTVKLNLGFLSTFYISWFIDTIKFVHGL
jgi:hypothetical protein